MRKYRGVLLAAAGFAVVATAAAFYAAVRRGVADAPPVEELLSDVPASAPALVYIDLAALRASSFYQHRPNRSPIALPDKDYANFVQATGFDFEKDLDRVVIASWPPSDVPDQKKTVVVAEGRFDRQKIRTYAMSKGKIEQQPGGDIFLFPGNAPRTWISLAFLNDHRIRLVDGPSVAAALAPPAEVSSASDPERQRAARLTGAAMFVIARVSAVPDNFAVGGMQSAQVAGLLRSLQWITLAARPEGDALRVALEGECRTSGDARQLVSVLETLRLIGQAALESPKTRQSMDPSTLGILEALLKTTDITQTGERVRILVEITPAVLKWNTH